MGLGEPAVAFAVDNTLALQALRRGDHEQALTFFAAAERHVADASVNDASIFYLNRGNLRLQRLELGLARRDLDRCISLATAVGADIVEHELEVSEFMARHNVGYPEYLAGNLPLSLEIMDQAAAMPVGASLAISAMDRARVLIEAGLSDAADRALLGAQEEFRRGRLHPGARRDRARARRLRRPERQSQGRAGARGFGSDPVQAAWQPSLAPGRRAVLAGSGPCRRAAANPADRARLAADRGASTTPSNAGAPFRTDSPR